MKPTDFFAEISLIFMRTVTNQKLYGNEELTDDEIDRITDQILVLAEKEKENAKIHKPNQVSQ